MQSQRRIAEYGVQVGIMEKGPRNSITDVAGVRVGHCTLDHGDLRTGVTVVVPGDTCPCGEKPVAAAHIVNGYGKTVGTMQIQELGVLETPIALTGTLNVGRVQDALVQIMLERCSERGKPVTSINPVVGECNDSKLTDIARRPVHTEHVRMAMERASEDFMEGSVGAGKGMVCFGLKGGIGSASRMVEVGGTAYTLGMLVLSNFGTLTDLVVGGKQIGRRIDTIVKAREVAERGSIMMIVATDLPVDARQLGRILRRAPVGLARLGGYIGHGSGEVVIGFTTANTMPPEEEAAVSQMRVMREDLLDGPFRAIAECAEEAVLNSMICAETTTGYQGNVVTSLKDIWMQVWA